MNRSASHWIFVCLFAIQNQENCGFMRVWIRWNKVAQPFESSEHIEVRSCFHIISAVPMKQYRWSFSSPKAFSAQHFTWMAAGFVRRRGSSICTMLERMFFFLSFFLTLITWLVLFLKALTNLTRWEWFVGGTAGTYGHRLPWKCVEFLHFHVFVTAGVNLVPAGFWPYLLHANNRHAVSVEVKFTDGYLKQLCTSNVLCMCKGAIAWRMCIWCCQTWTIPHRQAEKDSVPPRPCKLGSSRKTPPLNTAFVFFKIVNQDTLFIQSTC